jgi:hypothetical protein
MALRNFMTSLSVGTSVVLDYGLKIKLDSNSIKIFMEIFYSSFQFEIRMNSKIFTINY